MIARRPSSLTGGAALAAAVVCAVLLASCASPSTSATPPVESAVASSSVPAPSGPLVTVPGLSSAVSSPSPSSSKAPPTTRRATPTSTPEPAPAPPTSEPVDTPDPLPAPETTAPTTAEPEPPAPPPTPLTRDPAPARGPISGNKIVVIDPGHNGANAANPDIINELVPAGFGQTKACNTTGTSTDDGYPEHDFNWAVANYLRPMLEAEGITVVMTRSSDDGVGPCVDKRAAIGNDAGADVVVSIHGDGDEPSATGFYVMTAEQDPAGAEMAARSKSLAVDVRDGLRSAGLSSSNHLGFDGLWPRNDLAGLNLSVRPTVMIEAGNMRNSADAALMMSDAGQQQFAQGLANGIMSYLSAG
jgi:N-acetylmuramoyl-L-alanine amidase